MSGSNVSMLCDGRWREGPRFMKSFKAWGHNMQDVESDLEM